MKHRSPMRTKAGPSMCRTRIAGRPSTSLESSFQILSPYLDQTKVVATNPQITISTAAIAENFDHLLIWLLFTFRCWSSVSIIQ